MINSYPKLNFPAIRLQAQRVGEQVQVWDSLRGRYVVLTPEEWVRRHVVAYLCDHCGVVPLAMVLEYPVPINGTAQRADIVVVDSEGRPKILVECKAADIKIDREVYAQAVRYNHIVKAQYLILTNGLTHFCFECRDGEYSRMDCFPTL